MTKDEMVKKVFDVFVAKYGRLHNNLDATITTNYIKREIDKRNNISYEDAISIADEAYRRITPNEMTFNDVFKNLLDLFGCEDEQNTAYKKNNEHIEKKTDKPVCKCAENIKTKHKYVSDTNELKTVKYLLPGIQKNNITIDVVGDEIRVSLNDVVVESPFINPDFKDIISIEEDMDLDNMKAKLDLGILTLTIPKKVKIEEKRTIKIS